MIEGRPRESLVLYDNPIEVRLSIAISQVESISRSADLFEELANKSQKGSC